MSDADARAKNEMDKTLAMWEHSEEEEEEDDEDEKSIKARNISQRQIYCNVIFRK